MTDLAPAPARPEARRRGSQPTHTSKATPVKGVSSITVGPWEWNTPEMTLLEEHMSKSRRFFVVLTLLGVCFLPLPSRGEEVGNSTTVLVVDDYATMRRIVRNLLAQIGYTKIEEAADGVTALQKLRQAKVGLVICDSNMEPMTGLQLLKEIRADAKLNAIPFIMITAESKTENVVAAKEAGINNYIVKPFNADTLKKKIESVLGR